MNSGKFPDSSRKRSPSMNKFLTLATILAAACLVSGGTASAQSVSIATQAAASSGVVTAAPGLKQMPFDDDSFYCQDGTLHGPGGLQEWSGDSDACNNPNKVIIGYNYACFNGYLFGRNGLKEWSGDSDVCGDKNRVVLAGRHACFNGYLFGPRGMKEWSGDSNACGNPKVIKFGNRFVCFAGYLIDHQGNEQWTGDSDYCGTHDIP